MGSEAPVIATAVGARGRVSDQPSWGRRLYELKKETGIGPQEWYAMDSGEQMFCTSAHTQYAQHVTPDDNQQF